jgi:hypothetical protein
MEQLALREDQVVVNAGEAALGDGQLVHPLEETLHAAEGKARRERAGAGVTELVQGAAVQLHRGLHAQIPGGGLAQIAAQVGEELLVGLLPLGELVKLGLAFLLGLGLALHGARGLP